MLRPPSRPSRVHVCVEKRADERLERSHRLDRRDRQRRSPAVNHDLAAAAVDGANERHPARALCECLGARAVSTR